MAYLMAKDAHRIVIASNMRTQYEKKPKKIELLSAFRMSIISSVYS